jgi:hypothetical protein
MQPAIHVLSQCAIFALAKTFNLFDQTLWRLEDPEMVKAN